MNSDAMVKKCDVILEVENVCEGKSIMCSECPFFVNGCVMKHAMAKLPEHSTFTGKIEKKNDSIHHPSHYAGTKIEVIDYIKDKLNGDKFTGYCLGNVIKYVSRYDKKGSPVEDLEKAYVYLGWAIESLKEEQEDA